MHKKTILGAFLMSMLLVFAAPVYAGDDRGQGYTPKSFVRAIHLSPDAPNVDVLANGNALIQDLEFTENSGFARVPSGSYDLEVVPAGATEPVVIDATLDLRPWRAYSVLAVNTLDSIEPIVLDDRRFWIGKKAAIRFVHASPDAPAVDIAVVNGPTLFEDVEFKETERYIRVPKGEYDLEVRLAGTDTVVLTVEDLDLKRRTAYTAVATGLVGDGTLGASLFEDRKRFRFR